LNIYTMFPVRYIP